MDIKRKIGLLWINSLFLCSYSNLSKLCFRCNGSGEKLLKIICYHQIWLKGDEFLGVANSKTSGFR